MKFKQPVSKQDEGSFESPTVEAFQNKSEVGCFCMCAMFLNVVKRMKFETLLVFHGVP